MNTLRSDSMDPTRRGGMKPRETFGRQRCPIITANARDAHA
ncbi:hypothetical protein [Falsiroseomonas selenitidurans]|nr:hypothetical protein [Falsiroseomonas selenitidurans]